MRTEVRPWGMFDVLLDKDEYWVKRLTIWPGQAISLQTHCLRAEEWVVVSGFGKAYRRHWPQTLRNGEWSELKPGVRVSVPQHFMHRIINDGELDLVVIETALGVCEEDDIVRYEDDFGRADKNPPEL